MITLSKTDYLIYRECRKSAWLKIHWPDVFQESGLSEFDKAIIESGNEVEGVARNLFPKGVLIERRDWNPPSPTLQIKHVALFFKMTFMLL